MKAKYWWLKERDNPQLNEPYYIAYGQISLKKAKSMENPLYGFNTMYRFSTQAEYDLKLSELKINNKIIHVH